MELGNFIGKQFAAEAQLQIQKNAFETQMGIEPATF